MHIALFSWGCITLFVSQFNGEYREAYLKHLIRKYKHMMYYEGSWSNSHLALLVLRDLGLALLVLCCEVLDLNCWSKI